MPNLESCRKTEQLMRKEKVSLEEEENNGLPRNPKEITKIEMKINNLKLLNWYFKRDYHNNLITLEMKEPYRFKLFVTLMIKK